MAQAQKRTHRKIYPRRGGNGSSLQAGGGLPPSYPLPFYSSSYLGGPLYHFRSDWVDSGGGGYNFTNFSGNSARVGDQVKKWANTYIQQGAAYVPLDYTTTAVTSVQPVPGTTPAIITHIDNYFHSQNFRQGYPILVEKGDFCVPGRTDQGQRYRGLKFTGTEYLQINGASIKDAFADGTFNTTPLFTTNGTSLMSGHYKNSGASFLFVIDQDPQEDNNPGANGLQALLYSRYPGNLSPAPCISSWLMPPGFCWPPSENMGIQYMRNGASYSPEPQFGRQKWGPEQAYPVAQGLDLVTGHSATIIPPAGGSFYGKWNSGSNPATNYERTKPGFQIILLEFDTNDTMNYDSRKTATSLDVNCLGPTVKLYAISAPVGGPWDDSSTNNFTTPKLIGKSPSLQFHTLFDRENLFLGGTPPYRAVASAPYGNGFRGIIYEFMMFEGKLSDADKQQLETIFTEKYRGLLEGLPC